MKKLLFITLIFINLFIILNAEDTTKIKSDLVILPDGAIGDYIEVEKSKSAVLMLHGFDYEINNIESMYKNLGLILASNNISSIRIDFRGFGKSPFPASETSISSMIEDAKEALDFLKNRGYKNIGIQGFGLGGGIAAELTVMRKKYIKSVSLWSSVINFNYQGKKEDEEIAIKTGNVSIDFGFTKIILGKKYFEDLKKYNFFDKFISLKKPLLVQYGENDPSYTNINSFKRNAYKGMEIITFKGGDYIFNFSSKNKSASESAISNTAYFFIDTLK